MNRGGFLQRLRTAGLTLALFALVFKAMLPPGFMLSADEGQRIVVTLCGGGETVLDLNGGSPDHAPAGGGPQCPFAFTSAPVLSPPEVAAPVPLLLAIDRAEAPFNDFAARAVSTGPPLPARGPPTFA